MKEQNPATGGTGEVRLIRKANELVEARYRYDIWETRMFAHVVSLVRSDDRDFQEYKVFLRDVIRAFGIDEGGKAYRAMVEGAKGLVNKKLFIERERDGRPTELETWLFTSAEYFKDDSAGSHIVVTFHPALKPYLLELKQRYLVYDIRNILRLTSAYSVRMYELLKQYEKLGKRSFDVEHLKLTLGIRAHEYKLYGHFKDKVILKSQADLAAETDISFEFVEHKQGKKIKSITFRIFPNSQWKATADAAARDAKPPKKTAAARAPEQSATAFDSPYFEEAFAIVGPWGVGETTLRNHLVEHGEGRVGEAIRCTADLLKGGKKLENPAGFYIKALEEGWKSPQQAQQAQSELSQKKEEEQREKLLASIAEKEALLEELLAARRAEANETIRSLTQSEPMLAAAAVNAILSDSFSRSMLESSTGLQIDSLELDDWRYNRQLRDAVTRQIEKMHPDEFRDLQGRFDEQILKLRKHLDALRREAGQKA